MFHEKQVQLPEFDVSRETCSSPQPGQILVSTHVS
jgi:hypothetical protein